MTDASDGARLFPVEDALDTDAWYTPPWIFDGLGLAFDLDVAHPSEPLEWIPTINRYSVADDGLGLPWHGLVWCNPPFSAAGPWCQRWATHAEGLLLIRSDLSIAGAHEAFRAATSLHVPRRRIVFVNGQAQAVAPAGSSRPDPRPSFSTIILGRGPRADGGLTRLAVRYGGATKYLR